MMQGAMGAAMMFSDIRLKTNVYALFRQANGLMLYGFHYIWDPVTRHFGYMAHEVEKLYPAAVVTHPSGSKMVDYGRL
jgi:hypothetical protein